MGRLIHQVLLSFLFSIIFVSFADASAFLNKNIEPESTTFKHQHVFLGIGLNVESNENSSYFLKNIWTEDLSEDADIDIENCSDYPTQIYVLVIVYAIIQYLRVRSKTKIKSRYRSFISNLDPPSFV